MPWPATLTGVASDNLSLDDVGVAPISGLNGGQSTFIGGDAVGISRDSTHADQAWNFLAWLENNDAQINVVAQGGNVLNRTDLAANQYTAADPRTVIFNTISAKGQTPFAGTSTRPSTTLKARGSSCSATRCSTTPEPDRHGQRRDQRVAPVRKRRVGGGEPGSRLADHLAFSH